MAGTDTGRAPQRRRAEILDLAAELFAEQGIDRTTVRELGNAAGMLSGSLYHYFDSKEAIVTEVITGYLEKRLADCRAIARDFPEPRARLAELMRTELRDVATSHAAKVGNTQSRYVLGLLPTQRAMHALASEVRAIWIETIRLGVEQGTFRDDVDADLFYALARKTSSVAQSWVDGLSSPVDPQSLLSKFGADGVAETWIGVLLDGFCKPAPRQ